MRSWMIGVISGIMPVSRLASLPPLVAVLLLSASALLILALSRRTVASFVSGLLLGLAVALLHGHQLLERRPSGECELMVVQLEGMVSSLPQIAAIRDGVARQRFEFRIERVQPRRCAGPRTILLSYYGERPINPGQRWRFHSKLKRPWGLANPGSFNMQSWYAQTGIDAIGSVRQKSVSLLSEPAGLATIHHQLRQLISHRIALLPVGEASISILRALTVADKSGMDKRLWQLFQQYGINHLLVISGLHIGLIAGLGFLLGNGLGRLGLLLGYPSIVVFMPGLLALLFAIAYAALAGFSLATNRALIMLAAFIVASLLGRSSGPWNNLLLAAFLVLLFNPLAALGSGFWLSFGAVAWLLWLGLWQRRGGTLRRIVYTHLCMSLLMIPLGGWWFGGASLVATIANLIMVPLIGIVVVPTALLGVFMQALTPSLGDWLLLVSAWPLEQLVPLARRMAQGAEHSLFWQFSPGLTGVLLAIAGLSILVTRQTPRSLTIALVLSLPLLIPRGRSWQEGQYLAKLTVLDVGQGSAIVLQGPRQTLVYDTGGGDPAGTNMATTVLLPYLRREGISSLDTLLVSHADNDHSAGAGALRSTLAVRQFLHSGVFPGSEGGLPCRAGQAWQWSSRIRFQILSPATGQALSSNNSSCVLQVQVGELRLLLPGDIDVKQEKTIVSYWRAKLRSDWLLAAHHGSNTSSSRLWLKNVLPAQVVFSAGYGNAFGHPHSSVIQRSREGNRSLYRTSTQGAMEFYLDAKGEVTVLPYRLEQARYWH